MPRTTLPTTTRNTYHHGQLRSALIAEARSILDAGGPEAVGLRETARRVGVSATATYRHFRDKDSLLAAVAAEGFREFGNTLAEAMRDTGRFSAMGRAYVDFALAHPGLFRLMFSPIIREREKYPELVDAADAAFRGLQSGAEANKAAAEEDVNASAIAAWALVHGLSYLLLNRVLPMETAPALLDALLPAQGPPHLPNSRV